MYFLSNLYEFCVKLICMNFMQKSYEVIPEECANYIENMHNFSLKLVNYSHEFKVKLLKILYKYRANVEQN